MSLLIPNALRSRACARIPRSSRQFFKFSRPRGSSSDDRQSPRYPFASGLRFGVAFIVPIAFFYHYSGLRSAVNTAQQTLSEINRARENIRNGGANPSEALSFLRETAKFYVMGSGIPMGPFLVDIAFDIIQAKIDANPDLAVKNIVEDLAQGMSKVVEHHTTVTVPAALEMAGVVMEEAGKVATGAVGAVKESSLPEQIGAGGAAIAREVENFGRGAFEFVKSKVSNLGDAPLAEPEPEPQAEPEPQPQVEPEPEPAPEPEPEQGSESNIEPKP